MFILSIFVERLKDFMNDRKITSAALAADIGVSRTSVNRYLAETRVPCVENIILLADYFCCTTDFLLGLENESYSRTFKKCPSFDKQLDFLLKRFGYTAYSLHKQTKIPESAIYFWRDGIYKPTIDNVIIIAKCFNCSVDFVLGRI